MQSGRPPYNVDPKVAFKAEAVVKAMFKAGHNLSRYGYHWLMEIQVPCYTIMRSVTDNSRQWTASNLRAVQGRLGRQSIRDIHFDDATWTSSRRIYCLTSCGGLWSMQSAYKGTGGL